MKTLFSPFGRAIPIALTSGHTFVVTQQPVPVPGMFVAEAMARGAMQVEDEAQATDEVQAAAPTDEALALQRSSKIKEVLNGMLDGANEADFTADGKPQLARMKTLTGFAVTRAEVDAAWLEVSGPM
ncbi:hypothetical protein [Comamonas sp. NoAH]|uniref:hypothetical protein n=1 Tax=Comamonas halotolerans TaxID=3041496 RepID=UPI0024E148C7|nr:hypothetical protein [Comamonas sp. NoAH]